MNRAISHTVSELWERGRDSIPEDMMSSSHLIYSSPATLSFNSPGAEGFGVKRAGLSVPGSVMLIVSPGCCGRNTSSISTMKGYEDRFFYLTMDETDLVTGRHLRRIPRAVCELAAGLKKKPSVIMIFITCVDALLGTDMERVCRKAENMVNEELRTLSKDSGIAAEDRYIRVRPCYMYALTREGRKPPMVHVRQSIYSLLEPMKKKADSVNFMGYFAPVDEGSELRDLLRQIGVRKIREVSACADFGEFQKMAEANFNLVLNPEARPAAGDLQEKLGIPSIELVRLYQIDRIAAQYDAFGAALGVSFDYEAYRKEARAAMKRFREACPGAVFSVGEAINADPFELALALVRYGFAVKEIFGTLTTDSYRYIRHLAALSPETRVYSNLAPSMLLYEESPLEEGQGVHIALGRDAGWYHPDSPCLQWGQDIQPFGFMGVKQFFEAVLQTAQGGRKDLFGSAIRLGGQTENGQLITEIGGGGSRKDEAENRKESPDSGGRSSETVSGPPKGYRRVLTPFAPDQSGAVSVFYELGGITVICDAGGCTGNICGFDEPRWFRERSAVFSAGLRDMDAILGRDDRLIAKLADAAAYLRDGAAEKAPAFTAIIGTPVPAVIGTDFKALERMAVKKTGLPCIGIACDGMEFYDKGVEKAYLALFDKFADKEPEDNKSPEADGTEKSRDKIGILGAQYMDLGGLADFAALREMTEGKSGRKAVVFGSREDGIRAFSDPGSLSENVVVTVSGYEAAKKLRAKYGVPFRCHNPLAERLIREIASQAEGAGKSAGRQIKIAGRKILVVHEQVTANSCREVLRNLGAEKVDVASWFMMKEELREAGDLRLREESDAAACVQKGNYDMIIADPVTIPLIRDYFDGIFAGLPHFAVSGKL